MPELPEVERARSLLAEVAEGKRIVAVETFEDNIVYAGGIVHTDFAVFEGQIVDRVLRVGKQAYFTTRDGPSALVHLGMSGHTFVRGAAEQLYYRKLKKADLDDEGAPLWPPRYCKLILTFETGAQWAFTDARRLGRLRLIDADLNPLEETPLSLLARDAHNDLPTLDEFSAALAKRKAPVKALLLDQDAIISGIGNYLIDEICYQSRIHPAQRANTLDAEQLVKLHEQISAVVGTAVGARADYRLFPKDWLFSHRWGKGKGKGGKTPAVTLPDGQDGTISFHTVGGRTSAVVASVQRLPDDADAVGPSKAGKAKGSPYKGKNRLKSAATATSETDSDAEVAEDAVEGKPSAAAVALGDTERTPKRSAARKAKRPSSAGKSPYFEHDGESSALSELDDDEDEVKPAKKRRSAVKVEDGDGPKVAVAAKVARKSRK